MPAVVVGDATDHYVDPMSRPTLVLDLLSQQQTAFDEALLACDHGLLATLSKATSGLLRFRSLNSKYVDTSIMHPVVGSCGAK
jgi:hypothetical protein